MDIPMPIRFEPGLRSQLPYPSRACGNFCPQVWQYSESADTEWVSSCKITQTFLGRSHQNAAIVPESRRFGNRSEGPRRHGRAPAGGAIRGSLQEPALEGCYRMYQCRYKTATTDTAWEAPRQARRRRLRRRVSGIRANMAETQLSASGTWRERSSGRGKAWASNARLPADSPAPRQAAPAGPAR